MYPGFYQFDAGQPCSSIAVKLFTQIITAGLYQTNSNAHMARSVVGSQPLILRATAAQLSRCLFNSKTTSQWFLCAEDKD
jgi:hypothetical protein